MPLPQLTDGDRSLTPNTITNHGPPNTPHSAASVGLPQGLPGVKIGSEGVRVNGSLNGPLAPESTGERAMQLQLQDGTTYTGISFGSNRSIAGELVFQTGMVGYPESITDPSYRGQILVFTFPLVGNYGVPSRTTQDQVVSRLSAHFESSQIHIAGLIVASYSGEDYSHHLATCSLGTWLKEQNIPAIYGVDTRALTKKIREKGSMLGKMAREVKQTDGLVNGHDGHLNGHADPEHQPVFESIDWFDPNTQNLVAEGKRALAVDRSTLAHSDISRQSLCKNLGSSLQRRTLSSIPPVVLSELFALM